MPARGEDDEPLRPVVLEMQAMADRLVRTARPSVVVGLVAVVVVLVLAPGLVSFPVVALWAASLLFVTTSRSGLVGAHERSAPERVARLRPLVGARRLEPPEATVEAARPPPSLAAMPLVTAPVAIVIAAITITATGRDDAVFGPTGATLALALASGAAAQALTARAVGSGLRQVADDWAAWEAEHRILLVRETAPPPVPVSVFALLRRRPLWTVLPPASLVGDWYRVPLDQVLDPD